MKKRKMQDDFKDITVIGAGIGTGLAVEGKLNPSVPVFTRFGRVAATAGIVKGASMVMKQLDKLYPRKKRRKK